MDWWSEVNVSVPVSGRHGWLLVSRRTEVMWTRRTRGNGRNGRREEIACHVISFAAQPWNTTPIRVSDDSTGSFAGTNNDPALCPGLPDHGHSVCHNEYMAVLLGQ